MSLFDALVARVGRDAVPKNSNAGSVLKARGVCRSGDFLRIQALPRRDWHENIEEKIERFTQRLRAPGGTMRLWPEQAAALHEVLECRGLFAPIAVGKGKALVTLLAPVVLQSERPVLLVPAQLRNQTIARVIPEMSKHWRLHPGLRVVGYSELSQAKNFKMLEELKPDLVMLDEAQAVCRDTSARTKRLRSFLKASPDTVVIALSGTMTRRSVRNYWRLLQACLGEVNAPLPMSYHELQDWADALDDDVDEEKRVAPGVLASLPGENPRDGYRKRLVETPGVLASNETELGVSLRIRELHFEGSPDIRQAMKRVQQTWTTPGGEEFSEAIELWRHLRELSLGFWYRWDPPAPREWLEVRSAWKKYVRETIRTNRRGLDSELRVAQEAINLVERFAARSVALPKPDGVRAYEAWAAIRDTFKPTPIAEWVSEALLIRCGEWLWATKGICWVEHKAFGEALAARSGVPYFGAGMEASTKILTVEGPIIASIAAHGEGKNLQRYSHNLVASPPASGKTWEQLLGRTHRFGQKADEVTVDVLLWTDAQRSALEKAKSEALYVQETLGQKQKLLFADYETAQLELDIGQDGV